MNRKCAITLVLSIVWADFFAHIQILTWSINSKRSHSRPIFSDGELAENELEVDGDDDEAEEDSLYEEQLEDEVEEMAGEIDFVKKVMEKDVDDDEIDKSIVESEASFVEQDEKREKNGKKGKARKKGEPWWNIIFFSHSWKIFRLCSTMSQCPHPFKTLKKNHS